MSAWFGSTMSMSPAVGGGQPASRRCRDSLRVRREAPSGTFRPASSAKLVAESVSFWVNWCGILGRGMGNTYNSDNLVMEKVQ